MKKLIALAAATLIVAVLASCTALRGPSEPEPDGDPPLSQPEVTEPSFAPDPEPAEPVGNLEFGNAMTWDDGVSVAVSMPAAYVPGEYAAGATLAQHVLFTITVTNGSTENFDGYVLSTLTSGGAAGSQIFDSTNNVMGPPSGTILPGQAITYFEAWSVADPASIVMSIAPGFEYEDAIFTNVG